MLLLHSTTPENKVNFLFGFAKNKYKRMGVKKGGRDGVKFVLDFRKQWNESVATSFTG